MKPNERIIKKGDYYQMETIEDLMMQQKLPKKDEAQSTSNIPIPNQNIITELVPREQALKNYQLAATAKIRTDDFGLNDYEDSLELLLQQPIRDEERLQIQKLLNEIAAVKNNSQLPLNTIPTKKQEQKDLEAPKQIQLISEFNIENLEENVKVLESIKYIELSRLEQIVDILLSEPKTETASQQNSTQIDDKTKEQIQTVYNNLSQLKCLNNLTGIVNKISSNEYKFIEMSKWTDKIEQANRINKEILDEFENDDLMLKQLEQNFKKNVESVRSIIKKLSD